MAKSVLFSLVLVLQVLLLPQQTHAGELVQDEKDCAEQLQTLASCIPYASGSSVRPTAECCLAAEKVRRSQPKCLCVLVIESTDPSVSIPINTTLVLRMPAACHSNANVSNCPSLLKLSPDSPNAKIFKDAEMAASSSTPAAPGGIGSDGGEGTGVMSEGGRLEGLVVGGVGSLVASMAMLLM